MSILHYSTQPKSFSTHQLPSNLTVHTPPLKHLYLTLLHRTKVLTCANQPIHTRKRSNNNIYHRNIYFKLAQSSQLLSQAENLGGSELTIHITRLNRLRIRKRVHDKRKQRPDKQHHVCHRAPGAQPKRAMIDIVAASNQKTYNGNCVAEIQKNNTRRDHSKKKTHDAVS